MDNYGDSGDGRDRWARKSPVLHRARLGFYPAGEIGNLVIQAASFSHQFANLSIGVHHRRMVPATESLADLGERQVGEFAAKVHGYLPGGDQGAATAGTA